VPIEEDEREEELTPETLAESRQTALANSSHSLPTDKSPCV